MLGKALHKLLDDEELDAGIEVKKADENLEEKGNSVLGSKDISIGLIIFIIALIVRLYVLFVAFDPNSPGWYDDTFHHWQIAYLTKEIGLDQGFLRLWDLKGMEFFWGLLHPVVLVVLFALTGSVDILIPRLLTVFSGSLAILFLFLLIRRYFNLNAALGSAAFAIFMPVVLFSDTVGMQEPLAIVILFGALLFWPKKPLLVGFLLSLVGMIRAEYWMFGSGLAVASLFSKEHFDKKMQLFIAWFLPTLLYAKYLLDYTGNPIYPIYWNYLASVKGEWFADIELSRGAIQTQFISRFIFVFGLIGTIITFIKRSRYYLLFLFGFINITFIGFMLGFGAYIRGYVERFWIDRLFSWPYTFTGVLISVLLFYWIPKKVNIRFLPSIVGWILLISLLMSTQLSWPLISKYAIDGKNRYDGEKKLANRAASYYKSGSFLIPEDRPVFTYGLVRENKIEGKVLIGQMFDPYFYFDRDPYLNWPMYQEKVIDDWINKYDIRLLVFQKDRERYNKLIELEPSYFRLLEETPTGFYIYEVKPGQILR